MLHLLLEHISYFNYYVPLLFFQSKIS